MGNAPSKVQKKLNRKSKVPPKDKYQSKDRNNGSMYSDSSYNNKNTNGFTNGLPSIDDIQLVSPLSQGGRHLINDSLKDKRYICGVDFGTCFTGFSILPIPQSDTDELRILTEKSWPDQPPRVASSKVPTVLNYYVSPEEVDMQDWGWSVDAAFPDPEVKKFGSIKLYLGQTPQNSNHPIFAKLEPLPPGVTTKSIISQYLTAIKPYIEALIGKHVNQVQNASGYCLISPSEIMYSFTVPIGWDEGQVHVMREAAFDAGFIEFLDADNLIFCHEPVAAAFSLVKKFEQKIGSGSTGLVVDAGGGTVDLFQCSIGPDLELCEVTKAAGDFFGGGLVDNIFWAFVENKLGSTCFEQLCKSANLRTCYRDILHKWDAMKREFTETETAWKSRRDRTQSYKSISLTAYAMEYFQSQTPQPKLDGYGEIRITLQDMKSFFDPAVNAIKEMVCHQLDDGKFTSNNPIDYLFLVGGFSCSPYLQAQIAQDERIKNRVLNIPLIDSPDSVVLEGASWYAWGYKSLHQRVSTKSLGIRGCRKFDHKLDREDEVVNKRSPEANWLVNKKFIPFVQVDDIIEVGATYTTPTLTSLERGVSTFQVYKTLSSTPPVDITFCKKIGQLRIDFSKWRNNPIIRTLQWDRFVATIQYGMIENWVLVRPVLDIDLTEEEWKQVQFKIPLFQGVNAVADKSGSVSV